eukprot:CAMPEP_0198261830 /NCGR_PEP_ID=MMETSP1447-20131203/10476_1 /TAXON_ID=420782 /ORGANISM="Chaetoceros dichaeta, Strain CCMP1751" /LENGTH=342 /DNA_ID=CAMNT_0043949873 /DNA_START=382 /DNA_END=1410 /DNA_ORIENTATION=+
MTQDEDDENENIQTEIDQMKSEALQKLNDMDTKMSSTPPATIRTTTDAATSSTTTTTASTDNSSTTTVPIRKNPSVSLPLDPMVEQLTLLSDTSWKMSLNIGREQGTWMPKDWGVSGDRLLINLQIDFTGQQLYKREDFLGGLGGARILKIKDNQMTLSPSVREGIQTIRALEGGWRVAKGQGPMGTDILRFYLEVEERISHTDGDVYCPAGRIYCNCGYFPMNRPDSGRKQRYREQLESMEEMANGLQSEMEEDTAFFSLGKIQKSSELMRIRVEMQKTAEMYTAARVMEPDGSLLKISNDGRTGLTKEGGICCKVEKSMGTEYHILGRFSIAPVNSRDSR